MRVLSIEDLKRLYLMFMSFCLHSGECRAAVVPFFYREAMAAFPNAKVRAIFEKTNQGVIISFLFGSSYITHFVRPSKLSLYLMLILFICI